MTKRFSLLLVAALLLLAPQARAAVENEGVIRVNQVVAPPAKSIAEAEAKAKHMALERILAMRGNTQLPKSAVKKMMADPARYVKTRLILNKDAVKGRYQPAFYFDVAMEGVDEQIQTANAASAAEYGSPRIQVVMILGRMPREFDNAEDREAWVDDLTTLAGEYYNREGFNIVGFTNISQDEIYRFRKLDDVEKKVLGQGNVPSAVDYYLFGHVDAPKGSVKARDGGAYHKAKIKLQYHFWDFNSGQAVNARRKVEGTGEDARDAMDEAMQNVVKAITQKASAPDVLKRWRRNIQEGAKYEITFCEGSLKYEYFDNLRTSLEEFGSVSGSKSDEVPLHVFQFPAGKAIDPVKEFERMLNAVKSGGAYADTRVKPVIYNKHKVFMFGNSNNCFGGSRTEAVSE